MTQNFKLSKATPGRGGGERGGGKRERRNFITELWVLMRVLFTSDLLLFSSLRTAELSFLSASMMDFFWTEASVEFKPWIKLAENSQRKRYTRGDDRQRFKTKFWVMDSIPWKFRNCAWKTLKRQSVSPDYHNVLENDSGSWQLHFKFCSKVSYQPGKIWIFSLMHQQGISFSILPGLLECIWIYRVVCLDIQRGNMVFHAVILISVRNTKQRKEVAMMIKF